MLAKTRSMTPMITKQNWYSSSKVTTGSTPLRKKSPGEQKVLRLRGDAGTRQIAYRCAWTLGANRYRSTVPAIF